MRARRSHFAVHGTRPGHKRRSGRTTVLAVGVVAALVFVAACGGGSESGATDAPVESPDEDDEDDENDEDEQASAGSAPGPEPTEVPADDGAPESAAEADTGDSGVLIVSEPNRFFELEWTVVAVRRSPVESEVADGWGTAVLPGEEDVDPTEDYVFVDIDVANPLDGVSYQIPDSWAVLVGPDGSRYRPYRSFERGSNQIAGWFEPEISRTQRLTVSYRIDADADLDGGWIELDQDGYVSAPLAGPDRFDEALRLPASFDTVTYTGPFSRDSATVEIVEAYWSREIGVADDDTLIGSPDFSSRRPEVGHVWLIVHFDLTCILGSINSGGCNVSSGVVRVDGAQAGGSSLNGLTNYDRTDSYWAAYPVPVDAESVSLLIGEPEREVSTNFAVTDLSPLGELTGPA